LLTFFANLDSHHNFYIIYQSHFVSMETMIVFNLKAELTVSASPIQ